MANTNKITTTNKTKRRTLIEWLRRNRLAHESHEAHCTSLCCGRGGQTMHVVNVAGCVHEAACLRDLGVREGAVVEVLRHGDPLLVKVGDARFGIGRNAATNVHCTFAKDDEAKSKPS